MYQISTQSRGSVLGFVYLGKCSFGVSRESGDIARVLSVVGGARKSFLRVSWENS